MLEGADQLPPDVTEREYSGPELLKRRARSQDGRRFLVPDRYVCLEALRRAIVPVELAPPPSTKTTFKDSLIVAGYRVPDAPNISKSSFPSAFTVG